MIERRRSQVEGKVSEVKKSKKIASGGSGASNEESVQLACCETNSCPSRCTHFGLSALG